MRNLILLTGIFLVVISCKKEIGVEGPAGPQGPPGNNAAAADTGSITGELVLYNEFGFKTTDFSGVTISLVSGSLQQTMTTAADGHYRFPGLATGTYDLAYTKTSYGTMKIFGLSHFAGSALPTTVKDVELIQVPVKTAIDSVYAPALNSLYAIIGIRLDTSSLSYTQYDQNFLLFVGKDANVGTTDHVIAYNQLIIPDGQGAYTYAFAKSDLSASFNPGDTMYITACTYNKFIRTTNSINSLELAGDGSFYIDPSTGLSVYPNLKPSPNVLKIVY